MEKVFIVIIYQIRNVLDNKVYIGQAKIIRIRKNNHFSKLRRNIHDNRHLQNAFNRDGEINFVFEPLLEIEDTQVKINDIETQMINSIPKNMRYNIALVGGAPGKGTTHTLEELSKMSASMKGKNVGKIPSIKTRAKMSESGKNRPPITEETRARLSELAKNRTQTLEFSIRMSELNQGEKAPLAKLTDNQVREIKFVHLPEGKLNNREIGKLYGVNRATIADIKRGSTWKHIK